jgi:hypothetical protein
VSSWTTPPPEREERVGRPPATQPERPEHHQHHHPHLSAGAHVVDKRGLTATGAVTIVLALGILGAAIDVNTGRGLRTVFAIFFVLGSALATMLVHREDLRATVVMPPLTYCVLALIGAGIGQTQLAGSWIKTQGMELVSALILGAPVLYAATGVALLIAVLRSRTAPRP